MKKILLSLILVAGFMLQRSEAQVRIGFGVNLNIGNLPDWGPSGYDNAQYYYMPDIDVYYDVVNREFVYFDGSSWVSSYELPSFCADFDLYSSYKVVINEPRPYLRADFYRKEYYKYRGYHGQQVIRERQGNGYKQPMYNQGRNFNDRRDNQPQGRRDEGLNQQQDQRRDANRGQSGQQQNSQRQWNGGNNNGSNSQIRGGQFNQQQGQRDVNRNQGNEPQNNDRKQWNGSNNNGGGFSNNGSNAQGRNMGQDQRSTQRRNDAGQNNGQNENRSVGRDGNAQRRRF